MPLLSKNLCDLPSLSFTVGLVRFFCLKRKKLMALFSWISPFYSLFHTALIHFSLGYLLLSFLLIIYSLTIGCDTLNDDKWTPSSCSSDGRNIQTIFLVRIYAILSIFFSFLWAPYLHDSSLKSSLFLISGLVVLLSLIDRNY